MGRKEAEAAARKAANSPGANHGNEDYTASDGSLRNVDVVRRHDGTHDVADGAVQADGSVDYDR